MTIRPQVEVTSARQDESGITLGVVEGGQHGEVRGSLLLVAAGRRPRLEALDLDRVGVKTDARGIVVDAKLRTSARGVYAIGDVVAKSPQFTHVAGYHAGIAVQNALLVPYAKTDYASLTRGDLLRPRAGARRHGRRRGPQAAPRRRAHAGGRTRRQRPGPDGARGARVDPARRPSQRLRPRGLDPGSARRRTRPCVGAGDRRRLEAQGRGAHDRAISDARRGQQGGGRRVLQTEAVRRAVKKSRCAFLPSPMRIR
ncbi:Mercuric ion reductase [Polaromonas sp. CG9_12]|nr:Mercuric ion reductase [Polaromonas sp. CG9_12]